jgi:hypothetical protein
MLSIEYRKLCSILFQHAYYQNKRSSDFTLVPTAACKAALEQNGLILKNSGDRTSVLQQMSGSLPEYPFAAPVCLSFLVYLNNPLLWNVTAVPLSGDPGAPLVRQFYLTNLKDDGTLQTGLTRHEKLSSDDVLPVLKPSRFTVEVPKGQTTAINFRRLQAGAGWVDAKSTTVKPEQEVVEIGLSQPGLYEMTKGLAGETPLKMLVSDAAVQSGPFFGMLDLWLDSNIVAGSTLITYIDNRLLEWNYVLIDIKSKKIQYGDPSEITITYARHTGDTESPSPVTFQMLAEADMNEKLKQMVQQIRDSSPDSVENVFVFKSNISVPLMQHRPPTVKLGIDGVSNFASLPVPDISTINIRGNTSLVYYNI